MNDINGVKIAVGHTLYSHNPSLVVEVVDIVDKPGWGEIARTRSFYNNAEVRLYTSARWEVVPEDQPLVCQLPPWDEDVERRKFLKKCDDFWLL